MRAPGRTLAELFALGTLVLTLLYFGLSPFDLRRPNLVRWGSDTPALVFDGNGIAFTSRELRISPSAEGALSIEAWLLPTGEESTRKSTILALDDGTSLPLEITTVSRSVTLRYPLEEHGALRSYAISLSPALDRGREGYVAVTSGPGGTRMYLDGVAPNPLRSPHALIDGARGFRGRLVIGSSPRGLYGWKGEFRGLAVYERTLGEAEITEHAQRVREAGPRALIGEPGLRALYAFDEGSGREVRNLVAEDPSLEVPEWLWALRWDVLAGLPSRAALRSERFQQDILLNLFGFVPLGGLLASIWRRRLGRATWLRFAAACSAGALLSLGIELGQAMLPSRYSSVLDLLLNVVGTAVGAGGWLLIERLQTPDELGWRPDRPTSDQP
jgi:VanZ family protein